MSKPIIIVMGVSGTGKSTIGRLLAETIQLPFYDGDDYHPIENIRKMQSGQPLNDQDRQGWLETLHALAMREAHASGAIIACSALKQKYRDILENGLPGPCFWVFLSGTFETLHARMQARTQHFMPAQLLQSQLETLEPPTQALQLDIELLPGEMVERISKALKDFPGLIIY
ncbi:MAG: gluconokinase [Saprospiraceae bacterium]